MRIASACTAIFLGLSISSVLSQPDGGAKKWDISLVDTLKLPPASTQRDVTFDKDIAPLLKTSCVRCHSGQRPRGGLKLDTRENALKGGHDGNMVVAGDSAKSLIVAAVARVNPRLAMPPTPRGRPGGPPPGGAPPGSPPPGADHASGGTNRANGPGGRGGPPPPPLTAEQVGLVRAWIDQGAK